MLNVTTFTEAFINRELDRYATWPGQACSYMIGKLKILELRKGAVSQLCKYTDMLVVQRVWKNRPDMNE